MKKINAALIAIIIVAVVAGAIGFAIYRSSLQPASDDKTLILYVGLGCPHCAEVEKFIADNNIDKKIQLVQKEVYYNRSNLAELIKRAQICGAVEGGRIPIPLLWLGNNQCIHGDKEIINYFSKFK